MGGVLGVQTNPNKIDRGLRALTPKDVKKPRVKG